MNIERILNSDCGFRILVTVMLVNELKTENTEAPIE